jgi:hypothetical protein
LVRAASLSEATSPDAFKEALQTYRELAKVNPQAYLPNVVTMHNSLGVLYRGTQRL